MKHIIVLLFLVLPTVFVAQNINQLDENGKRHGVWKKNFDNTNVIRYEGEFNHGKEIGLFKFYKNINMAAVLTATKEFNVKDDVADVTFYASNGKVISKGKMRGKDYIGEWIYYHKDAKQELRQDNKNSKEEWNGEGWVNYNSGQLAEKLEYKI